MDSSAVLSDDDYDVISNPGHDAFENNSFSAQEFLTFQAPPRELPAFEDAQDRFETTRWTASEIQAFVRKQIASTSSFDHRRIRIYVDGTFDTFNISHAMQLRQAKLAFPFVHLIVGVFPDDLLQKHDYSPTWPEIERAELVRHCRWVDEVLRDVPWELTPKFLDEKCIDFVLIDEGTSVDPTCDKVRVKGYDELKKHGKIIKSRRTNGLVSQQIAAAGSRRGTPNSGSPSETSAEQEEL